MPPKSRSPTSARDPAALATAAPPGPRADATTPRRCGVAGPGNDVAFPARLSETKHLVARRAGERDPPARQRCAAAAGTAPRAGSATGSIADIAVPVAVREVWKSGSLAPVP